MAGSVARRHTECLPVPPHEIPERAVRDLHSFRLTSRTRGVNDIGQVIWHDVDARRVIGLFGNFRRADDHDVSFGGWHPFRKALAGDQQWRARIVQHESQAIRWISGIQRHVGAAGLQNSEHRDGHVQ